MNSQLNNTAWTRITPMGGKYNWGYNQLHFGVRYQAAVGISSAAGATLVLNVPQLQDLERTIDKGNFNWTGGDFHLGSGLNPLFIVQP
ncbi:MAG: hypothetical protein EXS38_10255 [Opitutus sp.]|nr:hypothetical protein [Opitutus sp.]